MDATIRLKAGPEAPGEARREFSRTASQWLPDDTVATGALLVSELVTNIVRHGGCEADDSLDVRMDYGSGRVRVEVCQKTPIEQAHVVRDRTDREGGFGLALVEDLADTWGVQPDPPCVWFKLAA